MTSVISGMGKSVAILRVRTAGAKGSERKEGGTGGETLPWLGEVQVGGLEGYVTKQAGAFVVRPGYE